MKWVTKGLTRFRFATDVITFGTSLLMAGASRWQISANRG